MFYEDKHYYITPIANTLRVSRQTIYNLIKRGLLKTCSEKPLKISGKEINRYIGR